MYKCFCAAPFLYSMRESRWGQSLLLPSWRWQKVVSDLSRSSLRDSLSSWLTTSCLFLTWCSQTKVIVRKISHEEKSDSNETQSSFLSSFQPEYVGPWGKASFVPMYFYKVNIFWSENSDTLRLKGPWYWPLIGPGWSRDLDTGLWLAHGSLLSTWQSTGKCLLFPCKLSIFFSADLLLSKRFFTGRQVCEKKVILETFLDPTGYQ